MYYNKCPTCGSNNDPGEICDCRRLNNKYSEKIRSRSSKQIKNWLPSGYRFKIPAIKKLLE